MTGDCHVRFCESLGLQRPGPLTKTTIRAQKLAAALKACRKQAKAKWATCEGLARRKYGSLKKPKSSKEG
jgi:hypothetical protein